MSLLKTPGSISTPIRMTEAMCCPNAYAGLFVIIFVRYVSNTPNVNWSFFYEIGNYKLNTFGNIVADNQDFKLL